PLDSGLRRNDEQNSHVSSSAYLPWLVASEDEYAEILNKLQSSQKSPAHVRGFFHIALLQLTQ
ncbi:MAG: hypothetical protein WA777_21250, partial [Rhodanobacter sp.]